MKHPFSDKGNNELDDGQGIKLRIVFPVRLINSGGFTDICLIVSPATKIPAAAAATCHPLSLYLGRDSYSAVCSVNAVCNNAMCIIILLGKKTQTQIKGRHLV